MRAGFTLVELLVVIAIVAVLVAISIAVVSKGRDRAKDAAAVAKLRQLGSVFVSYTGDNFSRLPFGGRTTRPVGTPHSSTPE